jgi:hypothetical protein
MLSCETHLMQDPKGGVMGESITPLKHKTVFVSYAKQDEPVADYLQNFLNRAGYRTSTFTANIAPGDRWISSINQSLEMADVIVILLSKSALESPWISYEISVSVASAETGSGKRVIPVSLGRDISPSGILAQYQWINTSGNPEEVAQRVMQALEAPYEHDKAQERENALRNLTQAEYILGQDVRIWVQKSNERNTLLASRLLLFTVLILVGLIAVGIIITVLGNSPSLGLSIIGALVAIVTTPLAYIIGRFRSGVPDGRSDK